VTTERASLFDVLRRAEALTWDSPPETVGELLAADLQKVAPDLRELLKAQQRQEPCRFEVRTYLGSLAAFCTTHQRVHDGTFRG
jgi:hypothetical protein